MQNLLTSEIKRLSTQKCIQYSDVARIPSWGGVLIIVRKTLEISTYITTLVQKYQLK